MLAGLLLNRTVIGLLALAASHAFAVYYGYQWADRSAEITRLSEEYAALQRLWQVTEDAREADAQRLRANEAALAAMQQKADADAESLQDADRECLSGDDVGRLRQHFRSPR